MGIFKFFKRREGGKVTGRAKVRAAGATISAADFYAAVTPSVTSAAEAVKIGAVFRAVQIISDTIGRLPLMYERLNRAGGYFVAHTDAPLYYVLTRRPNAWQTAFVFWKNVVMNVLLRGNAFVLPVRGELGYVDELRLLSSGCVRFDRGSNTYEVQDSAAGVSGRFKASEILHFKNASLDGGFMGASTISFAANTLGIAASGDKEAAERFSSGGKFKAIYHQETDGQMGFSAGQYDDAEMERSAEDIEAKLNGGRNIITVPGAGKLEPLSMTSADLQFLESRKFTVTEIARFFGVPRAKIMDDSSMNYKSAELVNSDFYGDTLAPLLCMIEQELAAKIIPDTVRESYRFRFETRGLYEMDAFSRVALATKELANGTKTVNEIRLASGLPAIDGGDVLLVSANLKGAAGL